MQYGPWNHIYDLEGQINEVKYTIWKKYIDFI